MKKYALFFCLLALCCFSVKGHAEIAWTTNYQQALQQSQASHKPILLFFTGSDWCPYCIKLDREVFETAEFSQLAGDKFIFVLLDQPRNGSRSAEQNASVSQLQQKYGITGLPTVVLIDGSERVIGQLGYKAGGPAAYAKMLLSKLPAR